MSKVFEHDPAQEAAIEKMVATDSGAAVNGSGTGVGKTLIAVRTLAERGGDRFLIIAPPNTYENWAPTVNTIAGAQLRFCGNQKTRHTSKADAQANMAAAQLGEPGWFFVGREMYARQGRTETPIFRGRGKAKVPHMDTRTGKQKVRVTYEDVWGRARKFDSAAYDELQMISSHDSKGRKMFLALSADFKLGQSADWWGTDIGNMYEVHEMMWPGALGLNKAQWIDENMITEYDHFAFKKQKIVAEAWPGFFAASMPCYVAIPSPVEKPEPERRYVEMLPKQAALYEKLAKDMAAEIDGDLLVVEMPANLDMRLRELALGEFRVVDLPPRIDQEGNEVPRQTIAYDPGTPSATLDEIRSIQRDYPGEPMIILTGSQKFAEKAAIDLGGLPYTGKQTPTEKSEAEEAFKSGKVKVLVGTSAISEGLDGLQEVCRLAVIASRVSVPYKNTQFIGRVARRGQKRPVVALEVCVVDTVQVGVIHNSLATIFRNNSMKAEQKKIDAAAEKA